MNASRKSPAFVFVSLALIYLFTPLIAGVIGTYDRRGPKIFIQTHHELLYRVGYSFTHEDKPRIPLNQNRSWFYGIPGENTSK